MDRDEFARATRLGRLAAENLCGTLQGAPCDPVHVARLLDLLFSKAGGVPSLPGVLARIGEPLLVRFTPEATLDAIRACVRSRGAGTLDLQLERAADRYVSGGGLDARGLVGTFVRSVVMRFVFDARGGVVEQLKPALAYEVHERLLSAVAPVIEFAADLLASDPSRQRLGLTKQFLSSLEVDDDLVGD